MQELFLLAYTGLQFIQDCPSNIGTTGIIFTEIWLPPSRSQLSHRLLLLKQLTESFQDYPKGTL